MFVPRLEAEHAAANALVGRVAHYPEYPGETHPMQVLASLLREMGIEERVGVDDNGYPWILGYHGPPISEITGGSVTTLRPFVEHQMAIKSPAEIALSAVPSVSRQGLRLHDCGLRVSLPLVLATVQSTVESLQNLRVGDAFTFGPELPENLEGSSATLCASTSERGLGVALEARGVVLQQPRNLDYEPDLETSSDMSASDDSSPTADTIEQAPVVVRIELGAVTTKDVLDFQEKLAEAQAAEVRAITDHARSVTRLRRADGTLLARFGIELQSPEAPGQPWWYLF